jgi:hypothetical protein
MLTDALHQFVDHLGRLNRPAAWWIRPGVPADRLPAGAPESVAHWFAWADGIESFEGQLFNDASVIPGYTLVSVDEAARLMPAYGADPVLRDRWFPLLTTAAADLYAAVWAPGAEAQVASVVAGEPTEVEFGSIERMVDFFNACFDTEVFFVDDEQRLASDPGRYDELFAEMTGD